jgi:hypothetical protein
MNEDTFLLVLVFSFAMLTIIVTIAAIVALLLIIGR